VTVDRSLVDAIFVPYNRVDALDRCILASSRTLEVPVERNGGQYETNEREGRKERVWRGTHCNSPIRETTKHLAGNGVTWKCMSSHGTLRTEIET